MSEKKFIFAFDPKIKKRVLHVVNNKKATSVITGNTFKYQPNASSSSKGHYFGFRPKKRRD